jgi:NTE family protein
MGADFIIAVDLSSSVVGPHVSKLDAEKRLRPLPNMMDVVISSLNIMQMRVTRSRLAGEPADVVISPRLGYMRVLDYHHADEANDESHDSADSSSAKRRWRRRR